MKQLKLLFTVLFLAVLGLGNVWAVDPDYTLTPTAGSNNSYAGNCDVEIDNITWNVSGNAQQVPWRLGGKSISNTDRAVYSKTAYASAVSKIDLTVGAASSITVNSLKLVYSTNDDFSSSTEISGAFAANSTISFAPASGDFPAKAYYKFVFNVSVSGTSNKFVEFKKVEFYNATSGDPDPEPTCSTPTITFAEGAEVAKLTTDAAFTNAASVEYESTATGQAISWSVEDGKAGVATINASTGVVTIVGAGTAKIYASVAADATYCEKSAYYTLTVTEPPFEGTIVTMSKEESADIKFVTGSNAEASAVWANSNPLSAKGITFSGSKETSSNYSYYDGSVVRFYQDNSLIITPAAGITIVKIEIVRQTTTGSNSGTINCSGLTASTSNTTTNTNVYTGTATSAVTFTAAAQARFTEIKVYYTGTPSEVSVANPVLPAAVEFDGSKSIELTCETEDATIYYTLDGSEPSTSSTLYEGAFTLTETTTVKAIAVKDGMTNSAVVSATYTKIPVYASLAELVAAGAPVKPGYTVKVTLTDEEIKDFPNTKGVNLQSGSQTVQIYCSSTVYPNTWAVGGTLSGTLTCKWELYSGSTWELMPTSWNDLEYTAPSTPAETPEYASLAALLEGEGEPTTAGKDVIVSFENQKITKLANGAKGIYMMVGEQEIEIYCATANPASPAWETRGLVSATELAASWKKFSSTWELVITDWTGISYTAPAPLVLTSLAISGEATALEYTAGDVFNPAGLTITATYNDGEETKTLADGFEWEFTPATLSEGQTSVSVKAIVDEIQSAAFVVNDLTVTAEDTRKTATNGEDAFEAISGALNSDISFEAFKGDGTAEPKINNDGILLYQPGSGKSNGGYIVLTAVKGCKIDEVILTTTTSNATTIGYSIDDNDLATTGTDVVAGGTWKTAKNLNAEKVNVVCLGADKNHRTEIATITVKYTGEPILEPSLAVNVESLDFGNVNLNATVEAKVVTVTMEHLAAVTASLSGEGAAKFAIDATELTESGDINVSVVTTAEGEYTATLTISGEGVEAKEVALHVNVANISSMDDEAVDFTTLEPYASLATNANAAIETYSGISFNIQFSKGEGSSAPKYYENGSAIRIYQGNTITIESANNIYMVEVVYSGSYTNLDETTVANNKHGYVVCDGTSKTVTLNNTSSSQSRISGITVFYEDQKEEVRGGLSDGKFGTICVERMTLAPAGAHFYTLNKYDVAKQVLTVTENTTGRLEAGIPYIFESEGTEISGIVVANAEEAKENQNGFYAVLGADKVVTAEEAIAGNIYGINRDEVRPAGEGSIFRSGRCYIDLTEVSQTGVGSAPARAFRVIGGTSVATGFEGLELIEGATKLLQNGQIVILRDGKCYDTVGRIIK